MGFLSDIFGGDYKDAAKANTKRSKELRERGLDRFAPFVQGGAGALQQYNNSIGLGTPGSEQQFYNDFQLSPSQKFLQDTAGQAINRGAAGRGMLNSGNTADALARQQLLLGNQFLEQRRGHFQNARNFGLSATGSLQDVDAQGISGINTGRNQLASARVGFAQGIAGTAANLAGNAFSHFNKKPGGGNYF